MRQNQQEILVKGDSKINKWVKRIGHWIRQLLGIDPIRYAYAAIRYIWFVVFLRKFKTIDGDKDAVASNTVSHNLKSMRDLSSRRSFLLARPLSAIEALDENSKILCIGPRTEAELMILVAQGYKAHNIKGFDLISYSSWIDIGDMHKLPYKDNTWDSAMLGWVLAYSLKPEVAAQEVIRVCKPGAIIAVGVEFNPLSNEEISSVVGYDPGNTKRIETVQMILDFFGDAVDHVYFSHDIIEKRKNELGSIIAIFSIKK